MDQPTLMFQEAVVPGSHQAGSFFAATGAVPATSAAVPVVPFSGHLEVAQAAVPIVEDKEELNALRGEVKRLKELLEAKNSAVHKEKSSTSIIVDFHGDSSNEVPDAAWDIFSMVKRCSPSSSPIHKDIVEKYKSMGCAGGMMVFFDNFFSISQRKTTFFTEFYGGVTIFFSMAYILALNPIIVAGAIGMQYKPGLFFSTCLASGVFCCAMGILANIPVALAPGMGLNGYFANIARVAADGTLIGILTWQQGMASVFMSGIFYLFLTISGLRFLLFKAVPLDLRHAMSAGIGLFICTIGYKIGWIMGINYFGPTLSGPPQLIPFYNYDIVQVSLTGSAAARTSVLGLMWVSLFLTFGVRAGILCAIIVTTFCGIVGDGLGLDSVTSLKVWHENPIPFLADTSNLLAGHLDFSAMGTTHFWDVTWTFIFVEMFDSFGTLSTIMIKSGIGEGDVRKSDRAINNAMLIDGWGLLFGSLVGSNSITPFIESLTGIVGGARSGFAAFVTGCLFLLSMLFVFPFVAIIPDSATLPALFMVGVYSISEAVHVDWDDFPTAFSCFLIIITMPLTYSIANGIAAGFIFYNFTVSCRFVYFRLQAAMGSRGAPTAPAPSAPPAAAKADGPVGPRRPWHGPTGKAIWEAGWNPAEPKDFLPHPVMYLFGIFMCLRYRFFF